MLQLAYASRATVPFSDVDLTNLLAKARVNNHRLGITGMLLFHEGSFIQALEGPEAVVGALFEQIGKDKRHDQVLLIYKGIVEEPCFSDWSMGFFHASKKAALEIPGFSAILHKDMPHESLKEDPQRVRELLQQFRAGRWCHSVSAA